jgi:hypothetical protein
MTQARAKIILLDVDGVLVHPGGYRAALRATVRHFLGEQVEVHEDLLTDMEKHGIASEWDMAPLIIATVWTEQLTGRPIQDLPFDVSAAANELKYNRRGDPSIPSDTFMNPGGSPLLINIPEFKLVDGQYPAESAFHAGYFDSIPLELRRNLLTTTRSVQISHTMRIFQHYTLGSTDFEKTYRLASEIETDSFLLSHDQSMINDEIKARLFQPSHHLTAFTARPSGVPREVAESVVGYAPEAELALKLVGLEDIPLIAFGKLEYLAAQHGLDPAALIKPSPFQALAAVLAACIGDEWSALQAAYDWRQSNSLGGLFKQLPKKFELIVIEDTMGGVRSVRSAGEILQKAGFDAYVHPVGLTSGNAAKAAAFKNAGVQYFESWDSLIQGIDL